MKKKADKPSKLVSNVMFIFDVVLALLIIFGAGILIETGFGLFSMFFGFVMLFITVVLKVMRAW